MKNTKVVIGYNDVATTHSEYIKYFFNKDEAYRVSRWSEKKVEIVCPDCGHVILKRVCDLISYPFNCKRCGDKSTYPNKYMYEFLSQLSNIYNFNIYPEHVFSWSKNLTVDGIYRRIYDFLLTIDQQEIIVEVHGGQHFDGSFCKYYGARSLDDELKNDIYKRDLAISNGISENHYIVVDARKSRSDWIKDSILHSNIKQIFPFEEKDIDWQKCNAIACKSLVKTVSDIWNSGIKNTSLIGNKIGKTIPTVIEYLKKAYDLGWCDYTSKYVKRYERKPLLCIDNNIAFESAEVCEEYGVEVFGVYMRATSVQNAACGKHPTYRGKIFTYITKDEFLEHQKQYPGLTFIDKYFINTTIN